MPDRDESSRASPDSSSSCRNCGAPDPGRYCAACGQGTEHGRLRFRALLAAALDHLLDLDVPILRTAIGLTLRPGVICREYIEGKRKPYSNPLKYCFLAAAVLALVFAVFDISPSANLTGGEAAAPRSAAEFVAELTADGRKPSGDEVGQAFEQYFGNDGPRLIERNLNFVAFFAMPFVALALKLLFRREKLTYAEHFVFVLFSYGHLLLFNALASLLGAYATWQGMVIVTVFELCYLTWSGVFFYRAGAISTFARMILVLVSYSAASMVLGGTMLFVQAFYMMYLLISNTA